MSFIKFYILFLVLGLVVWALMILGQVSKPTKSSQWVWDVTQKKEYYAATLQSKKVVLVSGSNALFGIDSSMLSAALGMPVVNYAVNAGIGLPSILMQSQRIIKTDDIVILPLEYPLYSYDGKPGIQMIDYLYARTPWIIKELRWSEQLWLFWHVSFKRLLAGYSDGEEIRITQGLYGAHHINIYGDQINTEKSRQSEAMKEELKRHQEHPETYSESFNTQALGWEYLTSFVSWCEARNVTVIFMPSTLMYHHSYRDDKKESAFYENIVNEVKRRSWNYIGSPYTYMYNEEAYLNTNFHLTDEGRKKRTLQMIKELQLSNVFNVFQREDL